MAGQGSILGNRVLRKEDPGFLTGANRYFDDLPLAGGAHLVLLRSPVAHGRIRSLEVGTAPSMPGVLAVYTGDDLGLPSFQAFPAFPAILNRPLLATDKVRLVGDIVAAVVAESRAQGVDATEAIAVDYEILPAVTDCVAALADGAPLLFEEHGSNQVFASEHGADVDALAGADHVVECRTVTQRLAGVPMEPNGIVVTPEADGSLTVHVPSQAPFGVQAALAGMLGLEAAQVRVIAPSVGGGFGPKAAVYPEYFIAAAAARKLGRPVKWTETRSENMVSLVHGRDMVMTAKLGLTADGTFVGLDADVIAGAGAYPALGAILPTLTQMMSQGVYKIPKIHFRARSAMANTTTVGAYRGAGRPEATQMLERVVDQAAHELGIDPAEIRRKNFLDPADFPLTTLTGAAYDSGEYARALDVALEKSGYADLRREQAERRARGDKMLLGIGVAAYVEVTAPIGLHKEFGSVTVNADGSATAVVGTSAHGQGHETAFAMLVQEVLGIPMEKVTLVQSDTKLVPQGAGTLGSRSLQTGGSAVFTASQSVLERAKRLAGQLLEAAPDDIVVGNEVLHVAGTPTKAVNWVELAAEADRSGEGPLSHGGVFDGQASTFPFGTHVAVVEVDTETGRVELLRHVAVDDCGRILNPMLVTGQQHGGIAQGAAQALYEWVQYDPDGNPVTATLLDYAIPSAAELPSFETYNTETPSPRNPLGAKGIGESGTIGSTPAIHNAVADALWHLGVKNVDMPLTAERVWQAIAGA